MNSSRHATTRRSTFGTLIAAALVMTSFWLPSTLAAASPAGVSSLAGVNGTALSGGNGGCFHSGCSQTDVAGSGGGASSVQLCSATDLNCVGDYNTANEPRLVDAGGGGGAGGFDGCSGGSAGGGASKPARNADCVGGGGGGAGTGSAGRQLACDDNAASGAGATPSAPGDGGAGAGGQENGTAGNGPVGGDGYTSQASNGGGGGGGGGSYGGGGGGATNNCGAFGNGGGAGSSSSVAAMTVTNDTTASPGISLSYGSTPTVQTFTPGAEQTFVVPLGVTRLHVVATGGTGGNNGENDGFGGYGAVVTSTVPVTPGQTLYLDVASNGTSQIPVPAPTFTHVLGTAPDAVSTATLQATLQVGSSGLSGQVVSFLLNGTAVGTAFTDQNGVATLAGVSTSNPQGDYHDALVASFAGNSTYASAVGTGDYVVGLTAQVVSFTSNPSSGPGLGDTYTPTASGGGSNNPIGFSLDAATTNSACSISNGTITFNHSGTCVIDADQAGDDNYAAAPTAEQQVIVGKMSQGVSFTSTAPSAPGGGDTYAPTASSGGGSNNPVVFSIDAATTNDACSVSNGIVTFTHNGSCLIDADQDGNHDYSAAPTAQQQVAIDGIATATATALVIRPASLTAKVTAPSTPGTTVAGLVDFTVNGHAIGSATLTNGRASVTHTLAPGRSYHVVASYQGNSDFVTSSGSAQRTDPTIRATVHSAKARSRYGWYSNPVTIRFTCARGSKALSSPCPGPITLSASGARQHVSRTVSTVDGGAATATVKGINIDRTRPRVTVRGVTNGGVYRGAARRGQCVAHDAQSGVARCSLHTAIGRNGLTHYVATAVNRAGLKRSTHGSYRMQTIWIRNAPFTLATGFKLKVGTYRLYVASTSRPFYEWAAPANTTPPAGGNTGFTPVGAGVWRLTIHITSSMARRYKEWNLGVKVHGHLQLVRITLR